MAMQSGRKTKRRYWQDFVCRLLPWFRNRKAGFSIALLSADAVLICLIIVFVPYTKIDWDAYMSQVTGFLQGEKDYWKLEGDTGPLVYPAGFLYIYSLIYHLTGGGVYPAQILFGLLYIINLSLVFFIYLKTDLLPWWALSLLCLSKRIHSIFVLRLFNDCFAMTFLHASMALVICTHWRIALLIFSIAVSVKMNVLLYAPSLLLLMLEALDMFEITKLLAGAAAVQIFLGLPFLGSHPFAYISRAFNFNRVFIHFWSVNFKFLPEKVFVSKEFAIFLLVLHLLLLSAFSHYKWCKQEGGVLHLLKRTITSSCTRGRVKSSKILTNQHIVTVMFSGNFIGIVCARSLHYQFYSWYFYSLPYLLWRTPFPTAARLGMFVMVESCWNTYPSNLYSSAVLLVLHLVILLGIWMSPPEHPYVGGPESSSGGKKQ